jgi:hypothetical protein
MKKLNFKVGDKVKIREWDDLVNEFGTDKNGCIGIKNTVYEPGFEKYCGNVYTITSFYDGHPVINEEDFFYIDEEILEKVNEVPEEVVEDVNDIIQPSTHYKGDIECIEVIEQQDMGYNVGNAQKYIWRAGKKKGQSNEKDLKKAIDYLCREVYGKWFHELKEVI